MVKIKKENIKIKITHIKKKKDIKTKKDIISSALKQKVWDLNYTRSVGFCKCCNVNVVTLNTCHFSHKLAEKNGGKTDINNLTICCSNCNLSMGTIHFDVFKKKNGFDNKKLTKKLREQLLKFLYEENKKIK
jgi:5-methylcytosine-specific restriction endonuclease McrA